MVLQSIRPHLDQAVRATVGVSKRGYSTLKTRTTALWANHKRTVLWSLGLIALALGALVLFVYLWRKSPVFRALVLATVTAVALNLNHLAEWLKSRASREAVPEDQAISEGDDYGRLPGRAAPEFERLNILTAEHPDLVTQAASAQDGHL